MSTDTSLDTSIREPAPDAGESETILFAMDRARAQFAWKLGGLDAEALGRTFPPSTMTLGSLLKHLAFVEDFYAAEHAAGHWRDHSDSPTFPWAPEHFATDPEWPWHSAADDAPEHLYAVYRDAVTFAREAWTTAVTERGLDAPTLSDGDPRTLRRVLVDLVTEYSRHAGHADVFREAVDGLVGEDPPQD